MAVPSTAPASLYVGDLHPDVSDGQLYDAFSEFKSLASVRICRDSRSGKSLCYGYVNFISPQDAIRAIETKNHTALNGKLIRVAWSHRDPHVRKSGVGNVFVKNLSESINNVGLQELFGQFGNVISCKVVTTEDGRSKGYGFVQFDTQDSANSAIEKLNGSVIGNKHIYVGKFVNRSDRALPSPDARYTNLYVKNLDSDVTEDLLRMKFSEFGKIASLVIAKDEHGVSRGFGFVNYENPEDAKLATGKMNGLDLGTKSLYVGRAQKKAEREQLLRHLFEEKRREQIMKFKVLNVYVKNIGDEVTDEELKEHFSQCGSITSAKIMRDAKGISKGFGFVCFSNPEEANKAVNSLHGCMFHGKPLYVAIAQRKEDRQTQLQLHYARHLAGLAGPPTAIMPGGYPQLYYAAPSSVVSQGPPQPGIMCQPLVMRPGWRDNGFETPTVPPFQTSQLPIMPNNTQRQPRQSRSGMNGHMPPQSSNRFTSYMQHRNQSPISKDPSNQRGGRFKYVPNGRIRDSSKGSGAVPAASNAVGAVSEVSDLSSQLHAASSQKQKEILGERLYPLVQKLKPDLVAKITGMLLEMDNLELLVLLDSPESLAAKVEEAVQVLKISKAKVSVQDSMHPSCLSAEVALAVN